ncbi:MAG: hypothetical protein B7X04_01460 [Parcubacteria group bacterium 21-54-25]|nr:MAG: hypothetical protein B7X04_01460 [Parcubacteria group bacterium 21-54-25]HQU07594.1 site-specific integrase [Candidatus Paceibacterota bacterium]
MDKWHHHKTITREPALMATFRKMASGHWQAIVRRKGYPHAARTFRTKALAERWARGIENSIDEGEYAAASRISVGELLARYEERFTPAKRSRVKERSRIKTLTRHLGELPLSVLTPEAIVSYIEDRLEEVASDTARKELHTLSVIVDTGMALWEIGLRVNPVVVAKAILHATKLLKPGVKRERRPTPKELAALAKSSHWPLWEYAIETAMRRGEIAVQRREHRSGNVLHIPQTKTDQPRTIPLSRRAMEILDGLLERGDGAVWGITADAMTRAFARECRAANIADLRLHDLRHEGTSRLFEKGWTIPQVAAVTGHSDWSSLKRYTKLNPSRLAAKLGRRGKRRQARADLSDG